MGILVLKGPNGPVALDDGRAHGSGVPRWMNARRYPAYRQPVKPTAVGARYFPPEPDHDPLTDQPMPIAIGSKYDGGRVAYREAVYKAAKAGGEKLGFTKKAIEGLKP